MDVEVRKKLIAGGITALSLCVGCGGGYLLSKNGGVDEFLEDTIFNLDSDKDSQTSKNNKDSKDSTKDSKTDGVDAGAAGAGNAGANGTTKTELCDGCLR